MKTLWCCMGGGLSALLFILGFHFGDSFGEQDQREFQALCESPGVRCAVQLAPSYLATHNREIEVLPYITYEFRDDDGRMAGSDWVADKPGAGWQ